MIWVANRQFQSRSVLGPESTIPKSECFESQIDDFEVECFGSQIDDSKVEMFCDHIDDSKVVKLVLEKRLVLSFMFGGRAGTQLPFWSEHVLVVIMGKLQGYRYGLLPLPGDRAGLIGGHLTPGAAVAVCFDIYLSQICTGKPATAFTDIYLSQICTFVPVLPVVP